MSFAISGMWVVELLLDVRHETHVACIEDAEGRIAPVDLQPGDHINRSVIQIRLPPERAPVRLIVADGLGGVAHHLCCKLTFPDGTPTLLSREELNDCLDRVGKRLTWLAREKDPPVDWVQKLLLGYVATVVIYLLAGLWFSQSSVRIKITMGRWLPYLAGLGAFSGSWFTLAELSAAVRRKVGFVPVWLVAALIILGTFLLPIRLGKPTDFFDPYIHLAAIAGAAMAGIGRVLYSRYNRSKRRGRMDLEAPGRVGSEQLIKVLELFRIQDPDNFFITLDTVLVETLGVESYFLLVEDPTIGEYKYFRHRGLDVEKVTKITASRSTPDILGQILRSNNPLGIRDLQGDTYLAESLKKTSVPVAIGVHINLGSERIVVCISKYTKGSYGTDEESALKYLSQTLPLAWRLLEAEAEKTEVDRNRVRELSSLRKQTVVLDQAESHARDSLDEAAILIKGRKFSQALELLDHIKSFDTEILHDKYLMTIQTLILLGDEIALERTILRDEFAQLTVEDRIEVAGELDRIGFYGQALTVFEQASLEAPPNNHKIQESIERLKTTIKELGGGTGLLTLARRSLNDEFSELAILGVGGSGFVVRSYWSARDEYVAVKFLHATQSIDEIQQARFEREVEILSGLSHPNIISVHGKVPESRHPSFVMELLKGDPLDRYIGHRGSLNLSEVRHIGLGLGAALKYIHALGMVHRDLKPGNTFLTEERVVKLMDFGMVKVIEDSTLTMTGDVIGTPAYMSPEQRMGISTLGASTDIYSFGVILFEMITGKRPYPDEKTVLDQIRLKPPNLNDIVPGLPQDLVALIMTCLTPRPEDRLEDVSPLLEALERIPG